MERELTVAFTAWTNSQGTLSVIIGALGLAWAVYAKFRDWDEEKRKQLRESFAERHRRAQEPSLNTRVDVLEKKLDDANEELDNLRVQIQEMRRQMDGMSGMLTERIANLANNQCQCGGRP